MSKFKYISILSPKMQPQGKTDDMENLSVHPKVESGGLVKLVAAIAAYTSIPFVGSLNFPLIPLDVYTRLSCGQTIQEVDRDMYKDSPAFYYITWPGRKITVSLTQPNPRKDESCFKDGEYNQNTPVRHPRLF